MRQVRLTPQAAKDLSIFDELTRRRIKHASRHLAQHPLEGNLLKGITESGFAYG